MSCQPGIISQWEHKKDTMISCLDHKVGGLIICCVLDERCCDLKQPTEKNTTHKSSRRCELDAPETKYIRMVSVLVGRTSNISGVCQVQAIRRGIFRSNAMMYDECRVYIDSIGFGRRYYSLENKMMVFSCVAHSVNQRFHLP